MAPRFNFPCPEGDGQFPQLRGNSVPVNRTEGEHDTEVEGDDSEAVALTTLVTR